MNQLQPSSETNPASGEETLTPATRSGENTAHHSLLFGSVRRSKSFWIFGGILLVGAVTLVLLIVFGQFDLSRVTRVIERLTAVIEGLDPVIVIPLMAIMPVLGFPIVVVYLVAGARFGPVVGGVVVAAVTACHLLLTHAVARGMLSGPIQRFVARRHKHLPEIPVDEHAAIALIAGLVPGLPYVARNYLLALSGVRLRTYFWICLPIYVARSYVTILLGDLSVAPSGSRLAILLAVDAAKVAICAGVIWRLRVHHRRRAVTNAATVSKGSK